MQRTFTVFVPGRVCLFGEHSDWAGGYRRFNSAIPPGQVVISGTNQGLHARVRANPGRFVVRSVLPDGSDGGALDLPMAEPALAAEAENGGFFSYAAGVAHYMRTFYHVEGIEINNYRTTLPVKKGLSSSAALCVLVARAFNKAYDLKLTTRAEMEAAYQGEIRTPSRCGRMDQGCAYGQVPVLITFDGDFLQTRQLKVGCHFYLLIADLKGQKDTIRILADLNRAYPFAGDDTERQVQQYLGPINTEIVQNAVDILDRGDPEALGQLMTRAQQEFDRHLVPACSEELTAPKLHAVLTDPRVQELAYGGKGVGSQGDGCVQLVARGDQERQKLADYLTDNLGLDCFSLDLQPPQSVRKAVIPAAGFGTRMFPASKVVKKEFFPVITPDGVAKPIILTIVEEAVRAGVSQIALIVRPEDIPLFEAFFKEPVSAEHFNKLPENAKKYGLYLQELGECITFIPQTAQQGLGHAVNCAAEWVGNEPFLLMLGDHIYESDTDVPCAKQLIDAFEAGGQKSVVALYVACGEEVSHYGTVTGTWIDDDQRNLDVRELAEKPSLDYARNSLVTPGLDDDRFLCIYGLYVLTPAVFTHLQHEVDENLRESGEIQLTTALETLRQEEGILGYRMAGKRFDTGLPAPYVTTLAALYERTDTAKPEQEC